MRLGNDGNNKKCVRSVSHGLAYAQQERMFAKTEKQTKFMYYINIIMRSSQIWL